MNRSLVILACAALALPLVGCSGKSGGTKKSKTDKSAKPSKKGDGGTLPLGTDPTKPLDPAAVPKVPGGF